MPYITGIQRYQKWAAKYDPDTVKSRFTQVADIANAKAQEQLNYFYASENSARNLCHNLGLTTVEIPFYLDVVRECSSKCQKHSGGTLVVEIAAIKAKWVARGLDPDIIDSMMAICTGVCPAY